MQASKFTLKRSISSPRVTVTHDLGAGKIYLLLDSDGDNLAPYLSFLAGAPQDNVRLEEQGKSIAPVDILRIGFDEKLPEGGSISGYLRNMGVPQDSISAVMEAYDLSRVAYLSCAQLPASAQRQLSLLAALRSDAELIVLQDPFQPFSGRWREQFAEELLENVRSKGRCAIVVNLSFMPQHWLDKPEIIPVDVKSAAAEAIDRAIGIEREERERKLREEKAQAAQAKAQTHASQAHSLGNGVGQPGADVVIPESFAYRHVRDFVFEPLARVSSMLRTWSGALAASCFAILTLALGYVFIPAIMNSNNGFSEFAREWRDGMDAPPATNMDADLKPEGSSGQASDSQNEASQEHQLAQTEESPAGLDFYSLTDVRSEFDMPVDSLPDDSLFHSAEFQELVFGLMASEMPSAIAWCIPE